MRSEPISPPLRGLRDRAFAAAFLAMLGLFAGFVVLLLASDIALVDGEALRSVFAAPFVRDALWMSVWTSVSATALAVLFAVPIGYTLSRFRFPGRVVADALVDLPIVFPPLVAGLTLLVFFAQSPFGRFVQDDLGIEFIFQPKGIVLCQFFVAASLAIRAAATAFDDVDPRLEHVALTLGCTRGGAFFRVALPLAARGIIAGALLTWARAFGLFGPLIIFVGSFRGRTEVLSSTIFLEQSVGNLETALTLSLLLIAVALATLLAVKLLAARKW